MDLVGVLIVSALIIVVWNSPTAAAVFGVLGVAWVAATLRSVIEVTDDGFKIRGLLRTTHLAWADADAFVVVGFSGSDRPVLRSGLDYVAPSAEGPSVVGLSMEAINAEALTKRAGLFSVVAVVDNHGERLRVHGTASTPIDPDYAAHAATELNRMLKHHNPAATAA